MTKKLVKKALLAQYVLIIYNALEGVLSLFFGNVANSIALIGFGLDSAVESLSTIIVTLRLRKTGKVSIEEEEKHEKNALRLVGYSFIILAIYVGFESVRKIAGHEVPDPSFPGIIIALSSITVMPIFSKYRHNLGHEIKSKSLVADSKQTLLCVYMSYALLGGVGLNYLFGWWWADPVAGLIIVGVAVQEGINSLKGKECCSV